MCPVDGDNTPTNLNIKMLERKNKPLSLLKKNTNLARAGLCIQPIEPKSSPLTKKPRKK